MEKKAAFGIILTLLLTSVLTLAFNIQLVKASGTIYIRADGSVEPSTGLIQRDGDVYTFTADIFDSIVVEKDNIIINGNGKVLQGTGTGNGFQLFGRTNVTIRNVRITQFYTGIFLSSSYDNIMTENVVSSNTQGINLGWSENNTISGNTVTSNKGGIIVYQGSENVTVKDNTVTSNTFGIDLGMANMCTITRNHITDNMFGIELDHSFNNMLMGNNITNNDYIGMWVCSSGNNRISGNNVSLNSYVGIRLDYSGSNNNAVSGNIFSNNDYGIFLASSTNNNAIWGNDIANNNRGIYLSGTSNNMFFHNNLVGNNQQVVSYDSLSLWDDGYPSGGNYWSDYTGVDLYSGPNQDYPSGSDGMGDSAYLIDANNRDKYPLMNPWIERTVGVKVGEWTKYKYEFTWSSTDPNEQPPQDLVDLITHLEWYGITVLKVFDTTITFQTMMHFMNGTETKSLWVVDIDNGSGNGTYLQAFIAANLSKGHRLCTPAPGQFVWCGWQIEETILRPYVGVVRETNHLNVTNWSFIGRYPPLEFNSVDDFYWDSATGIISEHVHQQNFEREGYVTSLSLMMKIVDTNLWKTPVVSTAIDIDPDTLNLRSNGQWITAYIELPKGYNVSDIDVSSIKLNDTVAAKLKPIRIGDYDCDGIPDLMVKFNRATVIKYILSVIETPTKFRTVTLTITGKLNDGKPFQGNCTIRVIYIDIHEIFIARMLRYERHIERFLI